MSLREYQKSGVDKIREKALEGKKKILFILPTGGGKTRTFTHIVEKAVEKNNRSLILVYGKDLVEQAAERQIDAGIIMAGKKSDESKKIQVGSISTVKRRNPDFVKDFEVVIIDEAHQWCQNSYQEYLESLNPGIIIGFTATPYAVGRKGHTFWDDYIIVATPDDLARDNFLVYPTIYTINEVDASDVKISKGDYDERELWEKMKDSQITGDVVSNYLERAENKRALTFCINIEHAHLMKEVFENAGVKSEVITGDTPIEKREKIISLFKQKKILNILNVGVLTTGSDIPEIEIIILLRHTMSENLHIQIAGRGARPCKICSCGVQYDNSEACPACGSKDPVFHKKTFLIHDHVGNCRRLGHPFMYREPVMENLSAKESKERKDLLEMQMTDCDNCFYTYSREEKKCPECGCENEKRKQDIRTEKGDLFFMDNDFAKDREEYFNEIKESYGKYMHNFNVRKEIKNPHYAAEQVFKKYGKLSFREFLKRFYNDHFERDYHGFIEERLLRRASKKAVRNKKGGSRKL